MLSSRRKTILKPKSRCVLCVRTLSGANHQSPLFLSILTLGKNLWISRKKQYRNGYGRFWTLF